VDAQQDPHAALLDVRARLRPMGVGDLLDETIRLYRENFLLFVATTAALLAPVLLAGAIAALGGAVVAPGVIDQSGLSAPSAPNPALAVLFVVLVIAGVVSGLLVAAAVTVVTSERYLGRPITVRAAYAAALKRLGPLLLAALWAGIRLIPVIAICAFAIGVPFLIYYIIAWLLIPQAVMLEGCGAGGASKRSRQLVDGYWWKTLGFYLVLSILLNILAAIPTLLLTAVVGGVAGIATGSATALVVVYAIVSVVVPVLLLPLALVATTLLFYDLKIRKEAFDLETMARQVVEGVGRGKVAGGQTPGV